MTSKNKKHTFAKNEIIDSIIDLRLNKGWSRLSILNFLKEDCGYSQSYSYELIQDASKEFDERAIQNFGKDLKEDIERFEALYEKSMTSKNFREAKEILKEISKLKGHYVERIDVSGKIDHNVTVIKLRNVNGTRD